MQFGFILLVLAVILQLASIDADATVLSPTGPVGFASVDGEGARFLRASAIADDDEERPDTAAADKISTVLARLAEKAEQSLRADAAELVKLTKSVPDSPAEYDVYLATLKKAKKNFTRNANRHFDEDLKATPDDLIRQYNLDPELALKMTNTKSLEVLKDADPALYVMWFKYSKHYKRNNPNWKPIYGLAKLTRY
ncbi:hypothetical protein PHYSODRAFT_330133 [Phytophthora sojae]|uniref:RxLR effector protein n=1 Tax=Phytophthora sojae (strain P6497) TaxID=1094619 RepID=G4Z4X9_PHYSP|nr:hypothetical protein PHYSODRAFT_330133 [Phytophthora sojae]EGZ22308.1 hypothetical protein PHYSODRAFT_330133 [Phytophthora sojae]|eukprot:XP_009525025.1 hypothetical protein PHYSODRAFT_330133 [Phytophthora sojae]